MKLYFGKPVLPGVMRFMANGYWFRGRDEKEFTYRKYSKPQPIDWEIKGMWGVSIFGLFIGAILNKNPHIKGGK